MIKIHTSVACMLLLAASFSCKGQVTGREPVEYNDALLQKIKTAAGALPGALPVSINYLKYASSTRKCKAIGVGIPADTVRCYLRGAGWAVDELFKTCIGTWLGACAAAIRPFSSKGKSRIVLIQVGLARNGCTI